MRPAAFLPPDASLKAQRLAALSSAAQALLAAFCTDCRIRPQRPGGEAHYADPTLCRRCDEQVAGLPAIFADSPQ